MQGRTTEVADGLVSRGPRRMSGAPARSAGPRARRRHGAGGAPVPHVARVATKDPAWRR
jgi:hypothetical protein